MTRDTQAETPHLRLLDLDSDDLLALADDLHQLVTLLHQLGLVHGCVHLTGTAAHGVGRDTKHTGVGRDTQRF